MVNLAALLGVFVFIVLVAALLSADLEVELGKLLILGTNK